MPENNPRRQARLIGEAEGYLVLGMAERALEALAGVDGTTFRVSFLRGMAYRHLELYAEALRAFAPAYLARQSQAELDGVVSLLIAMAWCYKRVDRVPHSIDMLQEAHKLDPDNALLLYNLACYWALLENKTQALTWLGLALRKDNSYRKLIPSESDFDALRDDPDFQFMTGLREHGRPAIGE